LFTDEIIQYVVDEGGISISGEEWLAHHPIKYRDTILRAVKAPNVTEDYRYSIFPKVELQVGDPMEVKERCIYGPSAHKKYNTGPFMHKMEEILHKWCKSYCGQKNWTDITTTVTDAENAFLKAKLTPTGVEADFSRYDSTQRKFILSLWTKMVERIVDEAPIYWGLDQDAAKVKDYVKQTMLIKLTAFQGLVTAKAYSRASGDTWTTLGNTITSMCLWSAVLAPYGFNPWLDGIRKGFKAVFLLFKGDDMFGLVDKKDVTSFKEAVVAGFNKDNTKEPYGVGCIVKVVEEGPISQRSYLSALFVPRRAGGYRMVRKLERVLTNNPFSTQAKITDHDIDKVALELLHSKGLSLLAWGQGLPIVDVLARKMIQLGKPGLKHTDYAAKWQICTDNLSTDYEDYATWLFEKYGLTDADIQRIEGRIQKIKNPLEEVIIPELDIILQ